MKRGALAAGGQYRDAGIRTSGYAREDAGSRALNQIALQCRRLGARERKLNLPLAHEHKAAVVRHGASEP